ncbi:unnamed protein product [Ectocarpus sp. CCAP 1310/34]|nr:unnamed protein product [Ectocarpus sp. CCAP 1310/34]
MAVDGDGSTTPLVMLVARPRRRPVRISEGAKRVCMIPGLKLTLLGLQAS